MDENISDSRYAVSRSSFKALTLSWRAADNYMVALITRESVDELGLRLGMKVIAIAKATDIVILTDEGHSLSSLSSMYRTLSSSRALPPCG